VDEPGNLQVAVVGDRQTGHGPQDAIEAALAHSAAELAIDVTVRWHATPVLADDAAGALRDADAVWCAPGGPFANLDGALAGIGFARERQLPFLGTCAGFQHGVIEVARHVAGIRDAQHAEYGATGAPLIIDELLCSLVGETMRVQLVDELVRAAYGAREAVEEYYCRFGLDEQYIDVLASAGLVVAGVDEADGSTRIMRLTGHPFFCLTLFVPQTSSRARRPHPLVTAYLAAARARGVSR
jgi:CTP synthase (UTP-ammonia lyase)